jgi:hypothetical protein
MIGLPSAGVRAGGVAALETPAPGAGSLSLRARMCARLAG